jgi:hypothetical protein
MSEFNIEVQGGSSVRLPTAGKYCEKDIIVTASGGGGTEEIENIIDQSGVLDSTDGTATDKVNLLINYTHFLQGLYGIRIYSNDSIEHICFYIDWASLVEFQYARNLKTMVGVDATKLEHCRSMFNGCKNLVSIQVPFDLSKHSAYNLSSMFNGCSSLVDVGFVDESIKGSITIPSPVLSKESISGEQGIINGLNSEVTGQTLTIPRNAVKKAFETSEGANNGDESAEWLSLKDSKPNWTISLS